MVLELLLELAPVPVLGGVPWVASLLVVVLELGVLLRVLVLLALLLGCSPVLVPPP